MSTSYKVVLGAHGGVETDNSYVVSERESQMVWIWDIGPELPIQPKRPPAPKGREGDPEFETAMVEFKHVLKAYEKDLEQYVAQQAEFVKWKNDGPVQIQQWSSNATDTFKYDKEAVAEGRQSRPRYYISDRTRGYRGLTNMGLPEGIKTSKAWQEQLRREREGEEDLARARKEDPIFGERQVA